jgi:hypothetical protein
MWKYAILGFFVLLISCNDPDDCQLIPYSNNMGVRFNFLFEQERAIEFDSIKVFPYERFANDTVAITGTVLFPLDLNQDTVRYQFFTDSTDYFLEIQYKTEVILEELNCDPAVRFFGLEVSGTNFDSVNIVGPVIDRTLYQTNIEIFF